MSEENVEVVRRLWEAYGKGDIPSFLATLSPDVITHQTPPIPDARTYHGHDGMLQALSDYTEAFDEFVMTAKEFADAGNGKVMVRVHQKALGAESGVPVEGEFWFVFMVDEEKITRLDMFNFRDQALEAAGLSE